MWAWVFMLIMDLLVPVSMLYFGRRFKKNAPRDINATFGYRTAMSMKNKETWKFAHQYCGKLWEACGLILLAVAVVAMLFALGKDINTVGIIGTAVSAVQVVVMIGTIFPVEAALKRNFDKNGNRIEP